MVEIGVRRKVMGP